MEKLEKKQPHKRVVGRFSPESIFGFFILLLLVLANINELRISEDIKIFETIFVNFIGIYLIFIVYSRLLYKGTKCEYCNKQARAFQKLILITWYKYSGGEKGEVVCLHTGCHERAKYEGKEYKIPDTDFSEFKYD